MTNKTRQSAKKKLLEVLANNPNVEFACKQAGIGRATYYRWREESEEFEEAADLAKAQGRDRINDLAESKLVTGINNGEFRFIKYWLDHNHHRYIHKKRVNLPFRRPIMRHRFLSPFYDE